jgi:DNA-binding XRE family transcriptional regulator
MKVFYMSDREPVQLAAASFQPMSADAFLPGYLCQAARALLNVSQAWLWEQADVSRKTINDFENGFLAPQPGIIKRIRAALESAGARFVISNDAVGVIVHQSPADALAGSRSAKRRNASVNHNS